MKLKSKLFAGAVAVTMILSAAPFVASAQTSAELTAQINALLAQIAQLQAQIAGGSSTTTTTTGSGTYAGTSMFDKDLTVGSTGSNVVDLQRWLVNREFLTMPVGVAYGYFGGLTKAAVARFQVSKGITPAVGYFGPITRAALNAMLATTGGSTTTTTTAGCVAGSVYSSTTGALCLATTLPAGCTVGAAYSSTTGASCSTGVVSTGGITTPGVEGTLTVTNSTAGLVSTAYEGDSKVAILGFKVKAQTSDIAIQRIKINLGTSNSVYSDIYDTLYVTDESGNVLKSIDLNSTTVVKEGTTYYVTIAGFSYVVPKDTTKQMYIKADVNSSIDSADVTAWNLVNTITLADSGVRGVDGAGIDQYSPTTGSTVTKAVTIAATLADSATLKMSLNASSPKKGDAVASAGSGEDELDKLTVLVFDLKAEKDSVLVTDMILGVVDQTTSGAATVATAYLYDGSTELDNVSITLDQATFSDLEINIPKDTTKTLTLKVDVRDANGTLENFIAYASTTVAADLVAENSAGDTLALASRSGSATGNSIGVRNVGPEVTLVSKSITTAGVPQVGGTTNASTSTLTATFNVKVKAVGGDLYFGTNASATPMFATGAAYFKLYKSGVSAGTIGVNTATTTAFATPSGVTVSTNTFTLPEGSEVTIPVTFQTYGRNTDGSVLLSGLYSVGLEGIQVNSIYASTFMAGEADWRTADVSFP